jgi:hypothetical protein
MRKRKERDPEDIQRDRWLATLTRVRREVAGPDHASRMKAGRRISKKS